MCSLGKSSWRRRSTKTTLVMVSPSKRGRVTPVAHESPVITCKKTHASKTTHSSKTCTPLRTPTWNVVNKEVEKVSKRTNSSKRTHSSHLKHGKQGGREGLKLSNFVHAWVTEDVREQRRVDSLRIRMMWYIYIDMILLLSHRKCREQRRVDSLYVVLMKIWHIHIYIILNTDITNIYKVMRE